MEQQEVTIISSVLLIIANNHSYMMLIVKCKALFFVSIGSEVAEFSCLLLKIN